MPPRHSPFGACLPATASGPPLIEVRENRRPWQGISFAKEPVASCLFSTVIHELLYSPDISSIINEITSLPGWEGALPTRQWSGCGATQEGTLLQ